MAKFQTEGPVKIVDFLNFVNRNTAEFSGSSLSSAFSSAKKGGVYLPVGDFDSPHAASETYGAEAGYSFWTNNDGNGARNFNASRARPLSGHFLSEFLWYMHIGNVKHKMVFPYVNYIYNISKSYAENGCSSWNGYSWIEPYREIDVKLYHSGIDKEKNSRQDLSGLINEIEIGEVYKDRYGNDFNAYFSTSLDYISHSNSNLISEIRPGNQIQVDGKIYTVVSHIYDASKSFAPYIITVDRNWEVSSSGTYYEVFSVILTSASSNQHYTDANISYLSSGNFSEILDPWVTYSVDAFQSDRIDNMFFPKETSFQQTGAVYLMHNATLGEGAYLEETGITAGYANWGYNYRIEYVPYYVPKWGICFRPYWTGSFFLSIPYACFQGYISYQILKPVWPSTAVEGPVFYFYNVPKSLTPWNFDHPSSRGLYDEVYLGVKNATFKNSYPWAWLGVPYSSIHATKEVYKYLPELYQKIHNPDFWKETSLYMSVAVDVNPVSVNTIFNSGAHDWFPRLRSTKSSPHNLGQNTVDNSRLTLMNPGSDVTDVPGKKLSIETFSEGDRITFNNSNQGPIFDNWNSLNHQRYMIRLSDYPEKVPVYIRAGDHAHGYLKITPETTLRYHVDKINNQWRVIEESKFLMSDGPWEDASATNPPEGWQAGSSVEQLTTDSDGNLELSVLGSASSGAFYTNVNVIPSKKTMLLIKASATEASAQIYINDQPFFGFTANNQYKSLSFIPNDYSLKISICPVEASKKIKIHNVKVIQEGDVLPEVYYIKEDALEAWEKLHYFEHDYYYNPSYNQSYLGGRNIKFTEVNYEGDGDFTIGSLQFPYIGLHLYDMEFASTYSSSSSTKLQIEFYILRKSDKTRVVAEQNFEYRPVAPLRGTSGNLEEQVSRPSAHTVSLTCKISDGTTQTSLPVIPYLDDRSTPVSQLIFTASASINTADNPKVEYHWSEDLETWNFIATKTYGSPNLTLNSGDGVFPVYPDELKDQYRYYRIRYIAQSSGGGIFPGTTVCEDIIQVASIANNGRITVIAENFLHYYKVKEDFTPDYSGNTLTGSATKVYLFEGLEYLIPKKTNVLQVEYPPSRSADPVFDDGPFDLNWQLIYPRQEGVLVNELHNSQSDDWESYRKAGKKAYRSSWLFVHNLRVQNNSHSAAEYSYYPGMADSNKTSADSGYNQYGLSDIRGPFSSLAKSAVSYLRFETLRRSLTEYAVVPKKPGFILKGFVKLSKSNVAGEPNSDGTESNGWFENRIPNKKPLSGTVYIDPNQTLDADILWTEDDIDFAPLQEDGVTPVFQVGDVKVPAGSFILSGENTAFLSEIIFDEEGNSLNSLLFPLWLDYNTSESKIYIEGVEYSIILIQDNNTLYLRDGNQEEYQNLVDDAGNSITINSVSFAISGVRAFVDYHQFILEQMYDTSHPESSISLILGYVVPSSSDRSDFDYTSVHEFDNAYLYTGRIKDSSRLLWSSEKWKFSEQAFPTDRYPELNAIYNTYFLSDARTIVAYYKANSSQGEPRTPEYKHAFGNDTSISTEISERDDGEFELVSNYIDFLDDSTNISAGWQQTVPTIESPDEIVYSCIGFAICPGGYEDLIDSGYEYQAKSEILWPYNAFQMATLDVDQFDTENAGGEKQGSIFGPIYNDIKHIPRSHNGLKLNIEYLIDLPLEDRLQIQRAATFWENIIQDDISIDVFISPTLTRSAGGTLAYAGVGEYIIGPESRFHSQGRAQVKNMLVYIDTDDLFVGASPDSSYTANGRTPIDNQYFVGPGGLEANRLCSILIHELAHGLGFGVSWNVDFLGFYEGDYQFGFANEFGAQYRGAQAVQQYKHIIDSATHILLYDNESKHIIKHTITSEIRNSFYTTSVPIQGGSFEEEYQSWQNHEVHGGHSAEYAKKAGDRLQPSFVELMSPVYDIKNAPVTRLTLGFLEDLGYSVDYSRAQGIGIPGIIDGTTNTVTDTRFYPNEVYLDYSRPSSGESILIGYTGTEYSKWLFYNPGGVATNFGGLSAEDRLSYGGEDALNEYLMRQYETVGDQLKLPEHAIRKCNCPNHNIHEIKNTILPDRTSE